MMTLPQLKAELDDLYSMREKAKSDDFWRNEVDEKIKKLLRDNLRVKDEFLKEPKVNIEKLFV